VEIAEVGAGARSLDRDRQSRIALNGHVANLNIAEEDDAGRSPVLERVGEDVDVHERTVELTGTELPDLEVGADEAERRPATVHTGAEQVPIEDAFDLAGIRRHSSAHAKPRRADTKIRVTVAPEFVFERRQLSRPKDVVEIGVDGVEIVN